MIITCNNCGSESVGISVVSCRIDGVLKTIRVLQCTECYWKKEEIKDYDNSDIYKY